MIFYIVLILLFLLILFSVTFILFKSRTPRDFNEFLMELQYIYLGFETNIQDLIYGPCFNKVSLYSQSSSVAVLTGGNRGLGLSILKKLLQCEMTVILGVRNIEAARKSVESYIDSSLLMNKVIYENCDTGDLSSVREFAKRVQERCRGINLLINNAGIMSGPYKLTKDGFETQMAVNYIGHFLLTHLLMPQLIFASKESGKTSRIVSVSSCSHHGGRVKYDDFNCTKFYNPGMSYCDSKLAQVMFTRHLHKMFIEKSWNVQPYSCHPGLVNTGIFENSLVKSLNWLRKLTMKTPEQGARTVIYAAIAPEIESNGGVYITNCRPSRMAKTAMDNAECRKFFSFTCDLLGIKNFGTD
ncbi:unnamed protein product [Chironomus riparius]|uniref:Uncharacterized protein n=1 Tax=Chironomus riparius TaxID=315576 RepID=A0A9N9WZ25_9DIPT|nr:unnamed protein product [Chironomus riparius]